MKRMLHNFLLFKNKNLKTLSLKPAFTIIAVVFCLVQVTAQKQKPVKVIKNRPASEMKRCGTMEALELQMQNDPSLRQNAEQFEQGYQQWLQNQSQRPTSPTSPSSPTSLPGPIEIPVVVHVVLPNPWIITDEQVQYFINGLNRDFSGLNADSTNCSFGGFCDRRGHSMLRFVLAKRDPQGKFTTGVVRVVGTTAITGGNQPIKNSNTATGGSTGWPISQYYNLYVGDGSAAGLLGISPGIGPGSAVLGSPTQDGVCVHWESFANGCFSYPEYNMSRTAVHEIGHNFGLYHTFQGGCTGSDFIQLTSGGCTLPVSLTNTTAGFDDTPQGAAPTQGCPAGSITNGCPTPVAKMFQNYMDYTDDACYSMFTNNQAKRMEYVVEFCRSGGYLTTLGGQFPGTMSTLDAAPTYVVSPGGAEANPIAPTCDLTGQTYPAQTCPGAFTPRLRITNAGTSTLTSITVTTTVNGNNAVTETFDLPSVAPGKSANITLSPQNAVAGVNALRFITSSPNGGADGNSLNDTLVYTFNTGTPLTIPFTENFASAVFPPANGSIVINPDGDITWDRATAGRPGPGSLFMDFYNYGDIGQRDIFALPPVVTEKYDSIRVTFYVADQQYTDDATPPTNDSLIVVYSGDCGATWQRSGYAKGGAQLSTTPASADEFTPTSANQWRKETVWLKDFCAKGLKNLRIGFQSYTDFGNQLYVDSITVIGFDGQTSNTGIESIVQPLPAICERTFAPQVAFTNLASDSTKSLTIRYVMDRSTDTISYQWTGSLGKCDRAIATLPSATVAFGAHVIEVFTSNPNGIADQDQANDYSIKYFTVLSDEDMPVTEGFEEPEFPPTNWGVYNVNGGTTWAGSNASARTGNGALLMNNPDASNSNNAVDYFISPIVNNNSSFDSVFVQFDMSYKSGANYPGSTVFPLDTLELLLTTDCGISFTSIWKKWGDALQTVNDPNYTYTTPFIPKKPVQAGEWRNEKVYVTPYLQDNSSFQVYFAMKGNKQNNLWIDNINIRGLALPERLKEQGYLVFYNPFNSSFLVHHSAVEPPVDLQSLQVYNAAGQLVWSKDYNGNAARQITVDLKGHANGMYIIKIIYTNRTVVERIVKTQ